MVLNLNDFLKKVKNSNLTQATNGLNTDLSSTFKTSQPLNGVSNALTAVPDQREIQQNIQKIAPNPATKTTAYKATAPMQGYNGVNQGANGYLGMFKSLLSNRPQLKPITAQNVLSNDWFNQVLSNINAKNQMKYNIALSNVLGGLARTQMINDTQKQIASQKLDAEKTMNDKLLKVKQQYNTIMDNYYKGLLNQKQAELELKKIGVNNPQDHLAEIAFQTRIKKYPDPQTWWSNIKDYYANLGYDIDINSPEEINKAYQYYLQTGQLPKPKTGNGGIFGSADNNIIGFDIPNNQSTQQAQPTQHTAELMKQAPEAKAKAVYDWAVENKLNPAEVRIDSKGNLWLITEDGNKYQVAIQ